MKLLIQIFCMCVALVAYGPGAQAQDTAGIVMPGPRIDGTVSVERALKLRRSNRALTEASLSRAELAQILWAAQGVTDPSHRTTPAAGALYSLSLYAVVANVDGLAQGIYRYEPLGHKLIKVRAGDERDGVVKAAVGQRLWIEHAPVILFGFVCAVVYGSFIAAAFVFFYNLAARRLPLGGAQASEAVTDGAHDYRNTARAREARLNCYSLYETSVSSPRLATGPITALMGAHE